MTKVLTAESWHKRSNAPSIKVSQATS